MTKEQDKGSSLSLTREDLSRIPYYATEDDFSTYYPSRNRIDKIVREIEKYLKYKNSHYVR